MKEKTYELLLAIIAALAVILVGVYIFYNIAEPINKACANTNSTVIVNGREIDCYQWKYNFTVH
jgi:flagellar biogenesis protein FliO